MAIEKELLDRLLAGRDPNEVFSRDGLLDDLKKAHSERILNTELDEQLDDEREADAPPNRCNGHSKKTVLTGTSKMQLSIPRDRAGTFDPKLIAKYQRRFPDFDDKIISMYARGMIDRSETRENPHDARLSKAADLFGTRVAETILARGQPTQGLLHPGAGEQPVLQSVVGQIAWQGPAQP